MVVHWLSVSAWSFSWDPALRLPYTRGVDTPVHRLWLIALKLQNSLTKVLSNENYIGFGEYFFENRRVEIVTIHKPSLTWNKLHPQWMNEWHFCSSVIISQSITHSISWFKNISINAVSLMRAACFLPGCHTTGFFFFFHWRLWMWETRNTTYKKECCIPNFK